MSGEFSSGQKPTLATVAGDGYMLNFYETSPPTIETGIPPIGELTPQTVGEPLIGPHTVVPDHRKPTVYGPGFSYPELRTDWKQILAASDAFYNRPPRFPNQGGWQGDGSILSHRARHARPEASATSGEQGSVAVLERTQAPEPQQHLGKHALRSTTQLGVNAGVEPGEPLGIRKFVTLAQPVSFSSGETARPTGAEALPLRLSTAYGEGDLAPNFSGQASQTEREDSQEPEALPAGAQRPALEPGSTAFVSSANTAPHPTAPPRTFVMPQSFKVVLGGDLTPVTHTASAEYALGQARAAQAAAQVKTPEAPAPSVRFGFQQGAHNQLQSDASQAQTPRFAILGGPGRLELPAAPAETQAVVGEQTVPKHLAEQAPAQAQPQPERNGAVAAKPEQVRSMPRTRRLGKIAAMSVVAGAAVLSARRFLGGNSGQRRR